MSNSPSTCSSVVVLSYPRYCRYRALLRRIEGKESDWMCREAVQMAIKSLGIPTTTNKLNIVFCRDTFEHEALLQNDLNCDHLAPKLKGRPRKKTTAIIRTNNGNTGSAAATAGTGSPANGTGNSTKDNAVTNGCPRSSSPESNTSEESKTSQIRTTRRSALNKSNSTDKTSNEQIFLKQLNKFMRERKTPIQRVPHLGFKQ
ncbi:unnamed protein product, partial [Medioppia subpectinata]